MRTDRGLQYVRVTIPGRYATCLKAVAKALGRVRDMIPADRWLEVDITELELVEQEQLLLRARHLGARKVVFSS